MSTNHRGGRPELPHGRTYHITWYIIPIFPMPPQIPPITYYLSQVLSRLLANHFLTCPVPFIYNWNVLLSTMALPKPKVLPPLTSLFNAVVPMIKYDQIFSETFLYEDVWFTTMGKEPSWHSTCNVGAASNPPPALTYVPLSASTQSGP